MEKKMTWDEMEKNFPDKWLLITDCDADEKSQFLGGLRSYEMRHQN